MENVLRYYLNMIKEAMHEISEDEQASFDAGEILAREPFKPTYIVTAVKLPTGAIELAVNNTNIEQKIDYILGAYDDDMKLKTNSEIQMINLMVV